MSLSNETTRPHFMKSYKSNYVKLVYNKLINEDGQDIFQKLSEKRIIKDEEIFSNIGSSPNVEHHFKNYKNLYKNIDHLHKIKFIFLGKQSKSVTEQLNKISENVLSGNPPYKDINLESIYSELRYQSISEMKDDFEIENVNKVVFSNIFISELTNTKHLTQILSNILIEYEGALVTPESVYLYGEKEDTIVEKIYQDIKFSILKKFREAEAEFSVNHVISYLLSFNVPKNVIDYFIDIYDDNIGTLIHHIINNYVIKRYLCNYIKFQNILFSYNNKNELNYPIDSSMAYYFEKPAHISGNYNEPLVLKNVKLINDSAAKNIKDLQLENNCIYMYNYFDIETHLEHTKRISLEVKKNVYEKFIIKLFPKLKTDKVLISTKESKEKLITGIKENSTLVDNYSSISKSFNEFNFIDSPNLTIDYSKQFMLSIKRKINISKGFDFKLLFNQIILNDEIPFVKLRDIYGTKDIIYKVYKPITERDSIKHQPDISIDTLDEWVKFRGYEFQNYEVKSIKTYPKYISFKVKFAKIRKNQPLNGKIYLVNEDNTYDIITDNGNIYSNIDSDDIIDDITSSDIEKKVSFYKNEYVYADIDLFKKNFIDFTIDLRYLPNIDGELISKINDKIEYFLDRIFSTDVLSRFNQINNYFRNDYLHKEPITNITNLVFQLTINLEKTHKLDYKILEQSANILYPFVIINDDIFNISTPIEYYDTDTSQWIKGTIKKINIDFTYDLQIYDPSKGKSKMETLNDIPKLKIRERGGNTKRLFKMLYKKVSDFNDLSPINTFLNKLNAVGLDTNNQVKRLIEIFLIEKEKAIELVSNYVEDSNVNKVSRGIDITVDYVNMLFKPNETKINVYIENINSLNQMTEIYHFMKLYFELALTIGKYIEKSEIFTVILSDDLYTDDGELNLDKIKSIQQKEEELNKMEENVDEIEDDEFSDIEDDDDDLFDDTDEEVEIEDPIETSLDDKPNPLLSEELKTDTKLTKVANKLHSSMILNKLKSRDPKLFDWSKDGTQSRGYSSTCQAGRQPVILTDKEKADIDKDFAERSKDWENIDNENPISPYSANNSNKDGVKFEYIDCEESTVKTMTDNQQCKSLKWGSSSDSSLHNWYICPKIYDLNSSRPIHVRELKFKRTDIKFNPGKILSSEWRTHRDSNPEYDGLDILEFEPYYEKDGIKYYPWVKSASDPEPTIYKSLLFAAKKEQDGFTPGLMGKGQHPEGLFMPCCFKKSMRVKNAFKVNENKPDIKTNYIQNWSHQLANGKYGLLNSHIQPFFTNLKPIPGEKNNAETGLIRDNKGCFIRYGIENDANNIFKVLSLFINLPESEIINRILRNTTSEIFQNLNRGDLHNQFIFNGIQSSFQNFLEYTISDQFKQLDFYLELLTNKKFKITNTNIFLIIFEIDYINSKVNIICPSYYNFSIDDIEKIGFLIKTNSGYYEPLCKFNLVNDIPTFLFNKDDVLKKHVNLTKVLGLFNKDGQCSKKISSEILKSDNKMNLIIGEDIHNIIKIIKNNLSEEYVIKNVIRDHYNKIIGIYLNNNITIPIHPQDYDGEYQSINIDSVKPVMLNNLEKCFESINKHLSLEKKIKIISYSKISERKFVITNTGNYINIVDIPDDKQSEIFVKTDYFDIDKELLNYKLSDSKQIFKPSMQITEAVDIIKDISNIDIVTLVQNSGKYIYAMIIKNKLSVELVIPVEEIKKENIPELIKEVSIIDTYEINLNIKDYMDNIVRFSRLTNYKIPCIPIRGLFNENENNKLYDRVVLETGLEINIKNSLRFNIWSRDINGMFKLNYIIDTPIIDKLFLRRNKITPITGINNRILNNIRITYKNNITQILKNKLYEIFQHDLLMDTKNYILKVIKSRVINHSLKKILTKPILRIIFDSLTKKVNENLTNLKKSKNVSCSINQCDNIYCVVENNNNVDYTKFTEDDILKLGIISIDSDDITDVSDVTFSLTKLKIDTDLHKELISIFNQTANIMKEFKSICKVKIVSNDSFDIEEYENLKKLLINEMLFNKYRSYEIFNYTNKYIASEQLEFNTDDEVIFMGSEYDLNTLNRLYVKNVNKYYNNILPFNRSIQRVSKILLSNIDRPITKQCILNNDIEKLTLDVLNCAGHAVLNKNKFITNNLHVILSSDEQDSLEKIIKSV